jgi:hypothetical protein
VANDLIGHWTLISCESVTDGRTEYPYGREPIGQLTYDAAGHMAAQIMRPEREPFASADPGEATPEEASAALAGYLAYFGTYSVDEGAGVVTHLVTASLFPNWVGGKQQRYFLLEGDRLSLTTPRIVLQGSERVFRLVWNRSK